MKIEELKEQQKLAIINTCLGNDLPNGKYYFSQNYRGDCYIHQTKPELVNGSSGFLSYCFHRVGRAELVSDWDTNYAEFEFRINPEII